MPCCYGLKYEQLEANYVLGTLYGMAGAGVGGCIWAMLVITTQHVYAAVAIGIAWLTAWAYVKGAQKIDSLGKCIGVLLTLGSVAFGDILYYAYAVHTHHPEIPFRLDVGWAVFQRVLTTSPGELAGEVLFGLLGVWYVFRYLQKPRFKPAIDQATAAPSQSLAK